jgi:hypothetical protein
VKQEGNNCRSAWMIIVIMPSEQSRELLRPMAEVIQSLALPTWSMVTVISYMLAFLLNIASSGNDSDLAYAIDRDPFFNSKALPDEFRRRLVSWRAINTVKCIFLLVAWLSVRYFPIRMEPQAKETLLQSDPVNEKDCFYVTEYE